MLSELIRHHVKEEEQSGGMFAQARKVNIDFDGLARKMKARKAELATDFKISGVPLPVTRSMKGVELKHSKS